MELLLEKKENWARETEKIKYLACSSLAFLKKPDHFTKTKMIMQFKAKEIIDLVQSNKEAVLTKCLLKDIVRLSQAKPSNKSVIT